MFGDHISLVDKRQETLLDMSEEPSPSGVTVSQYQLNIKKKNQFWDFCVRTPSNIRTEHVTCSTVSLKGGKNNNNMEIE